MYVLLLFFSNHSTSRIASQRPIDLIKKVRTTIKVLLTPKIFFRLNEISYKLQHFCKKNFDSVKASIIGALLKDEKSVEKDAILVHDRVIRGLGPVAL